jgi:hypothetical protein
MTSVVERLAFRYRDEDDDPTAQCPLALNGLGPYDGHCRACVRALRPPRGYQTYDYLGRPIVSTKIDIPLWITSQPAIPRNAIAICALR